MGLYEKEELGWFGFVRVLTRGLQGTNECLEGDLWRHSSHRRPSYPSYVSTILRDEMKQDETRRQIGKR